MHALSIHSADYNALYKDEAIKAQTNGNKLIQRALVWTMILIFKVTQLP